MKNLITIVLLLLFFQNTHAQSCITVSDDQNPDQCNYNFCGPYDFSKGVYRLPYPDGTLVHCTNDHFKHCPRGALDMSGASGQSSYNVVASADGWIRAINDEDSEECTCEGGDNCDNNYVWIEHPNGEWTKYTHVRQNSVDDLGLSEDDWVTRGTVIGKEGSVGCSTETMYILKWLYLLIPISYCLMKVVDGSTTIGQGTSCLFLRYQWK